MQNEMLTKIENGLAAGKTVFVCTCTRITKITPKTAQKWAAAGHALFKVGKSGSLYMANGNKYVCIDFCGIKIG